MPPGPRTDLVRRGLRRMTRRGPAAAATDSSTGPQPTADLPDAPLESDYVLLAGDQPQGQPGGPGDQEPRDDALLTRVLRGLEASGSDLAVVHPTLRETSGVRLADVPQAAGALTPDSVVVRRSFWDEHAFAVPEEPGAPVEPLLLRALLAADRIDTQPGSLLLRAAPLGGGDGPVAFGTVRRRLHLLDPWVRGVEQAEELLADPTLDAPAAAWLSSALTRLAEFLEDVERADEDQWETLVATAGRLVAQAEDDTWLSLPWRTRVALRLATLDERDALADFVLDGRLHGPEVPTRVRDGRVFADRERLGLPEPPDELLVPDPDLQLTATESPLVASLRRIRWTDDDTLELDVFAYARHVTSTGSTLAATLVDDRGQRVPLGVRSAIDPAVDRFARERHTDHAHGAFTLQVQAEAVRRGAAWHLELMLSNGGVTRFGTINHRDHNGTVGERPRRLSGGLAWGPSPDGDGVRIDVEAPAAVLTRPEVSRRTVRGALTDLRVPAVEVALRHPSGACAQAPLVRGPHGPTFDVTLPDVDFANGDDQEPTWTLVVLDEHGDEHRAVLGADPGPDRDHLVWRAGRGGAATVEETALRAVVRAVRLVSDASAEGEAADELIVDLGWLGAAPDRWTLLLRGDRVTLPGREETGLAPRALAPGAHTRVRIPLRCDEWGLGETVAPCGGYELLLRYGTRDHDPVTRRIVVAEDLVAAAPLELRGDRIRVRARQTPRRRLGVHLLPPLADDELGPRAQQLLQEHYADAGHRVEPDTVYLQSYTGETATDSQRAIHDQLRREHPHLRLRWGVADFATRLPAGASPVLLRSREWYAVLGSAGYLVNNIDFDDWFVKQPGQRFLQTFHGYPAKSMGLVQWRAKGFTERQIRAELQRTAAKWDLILTPVPEMNEHYRREYAYDGPIHDQGYPRDDALSARDAEDTRARVREQLGIRPDQTAVLYAPTFRDHLATAHRAAQLDAHLDLEAASEVLGEDYVLLLRGHRFHAREGQRLGAGRRRLLDVTDYPEVNDLILAVDVAVLDYSSLRFDFALTGKPMVFLVPDLADYSGPVRGFLFDYTDTAPGPMLESADEVVAALRDVPALRAAYAEQIADFNRRYQYHQDGHAAERVVRALLSP
ncbi:MAG TPA: CDP-glycerol glycerophosphotransferase family protein [Nocardioidaceae bacterium]|nr:CDP-glycerol glycerophosphotransferase family protein [Nocardioidaceae bacterium]